MQERFQYLCLPPIHQNTRLAEAFAARKTIFEYDPTSSGAMDYMRATKELVNDLEEAKVRKSLRERPLPTEDESLVDDVFAAFTRSPASIPPVHPAPPAHYASDAPPTLGAPNAPNKESTQTQEPAVGVRVGSKFSIEECRRYAKHLQETGQGINNPGGYATTIHRTGEADALIELFLNPGVVIEATDFSGCPDCKGSGFWYPEGMEKGVKKCRHESMSRTED